MVRKMSQFALLLTILVGAIMMITVAGCGGGEGVTTGAVAGWVYTDGEGNIIISGSAVPPEGFEPVENAIVSIGGYPNLTTTTDANGRYVITCIPSGTRDIIVEVDGIDTQFTVIVSPGEVTIGGGHIEGGGGL